MSEKHEYICLLGIDPKKVQKCNASECPTCGWEAAEAERRRAYLREHGLTLCADGLRRLIIPKNGGNEEMKYKVCDHCGAHLDNGETCDCRNTNNGKPEGIPIELADVIIRVLDYCGYAGIDIDAAISQKHEYNKTRPYRHGGKKC